MRKLYLSALALTLALSGSVFAQKKQQDIPLQFGASFSGSAKMKLCRNSVITVWVNLFIGDYTLSPVENGMEKFMAVQPNG